MTVYDICVYIYKYIYIYIYIYNLLSVILYIWCYVKEKSLALDNNAGNMSSVKIRLWIFPATFSCKKWWTAAPHFNSISIYCAYNRCCYGGWIE